MSTYRGRSSHFTRATVLLFMRNAIANYVGEVREEDFFLPIASLMSAMEIASMIRSGISPRKIQALEKHRSRRSRLDWEDENEAILRIVWNTVSCRRHLAELLIRKIDAKRARFTRLESKRDRIKLRLGELQRTLGLSNLERDIALLSFFVANAEMHAYFREYGRENSVNRRVVFLAQCLDRPVSEVAQAVESQGRLRRYGLLDADLGFNKDYDGFLYEVDKAPLATRFYRQSPEVPLPWSYYGALAERQGDVLKASRNLADLKPKAADCEALIGKLIEPHCELLGIKKGLAQGVSRPYSLAGLNIRGDMPPARILEAVRAFQDHKEDDPDRPRMNLLLTGPPGSGKTEFVKHLGEVLKTKVIVKTGSDILSMWVGGTEKNISHAFTEAENECAILFFDEVDGLMQARERAQRSWEVTQVNELLQRMESFDGVFIAATNYLQNLDPASIRRFTFKLAFDYLDRDGKIQFFRKMFNTAPTPEEVGELDAITHLVPGDFRTVRQGLFYLGGAATNADRLAALRRESDMKRQGGASTPAQPIGFRA